MYEKTNENDRDTIPKKAEIAMHIGMEAARSEK
jgi:hypothetical protein